MYSTLFDMPIWIVTYLILIADYFEASHDEYNVICTNNNSFRHFSITSVFFFIFYFDGTNHIMSFNFWSLYVLWSLAICSFAECSCSILCLLRFILVIKYQLRNNNSFTCQHFSMK